MAGKARKASATLESVGSHWLEVERGHSPEVFSREELHPELIVADVPRVGTVKVRYSVDCYVASSWNEKTSTSTRVWTDWRIVRREIEPSHGIGDVARSTIDAACEPLIRAWIVSDAYKQSRRVAAAYAAKRLISEQGSRYGYESVRRDVERMRADIGDFRTDRFMEALDHFEKGVSIMDAATLP